MSPDFFRDKRVTVMGLGLHGGGLGIAKWLMRRGAAVTVTDLKDQHALVSSISSLEREYLKAYAKLGRGRVHKIRYVLGRHDESDFTSSDLVIQNPGVPREHPLLALSRKSGVPVDTDIGIFFELCPFPITAVTGTKGKTTTTALLAAMCRAADPKTVIGGNIRISPLDALDRLLKMPSGKPHPIVLELSSWQLEGLETRRRSPHVGVITNIKEDHLNRYRDMDDYAAAKKLMVRFQTEGDIAILNADDSRLKTLRPAAATLWFTLNKFLAKEGCFIRGGAVFLTRGGKNARVCELADFKMPGRHNLANLLAAVCAASAVGVPVSTMRRVIRDFKGVPGRLEEIAVKKGVRYVNDTTATAPDATIAALETVGGKKKNIILISGGADKNLDFSGWAASVKKYAKHLVLFDGSATPKMEEALVNRKINIPIVGARSMREALREARLHARTGDIVLLSPGCASFGLFVNEFDRGDQFVREVKALRK